MVFEPYTFVPVDKKTDKEGNIYFKNFDLHAKIIESKFVSEFSDTMADESYFHIIL